MAISNVGASPTGHALCSSPYSNVLGWSSGVGNVAVTLPADAGSMWLVWQVKIAIPTGQSFNGVSISGYDNFLVGGGGSGMTRVATHRALLAKVFPTDFFDAYGDPIASPTGSGTDLAVSATLTNPAITSTDIANGNCYLGFLVKTDNANSTSGDGLFRTSALNWTFYTGPDVPNPPVGTASGYLNNPAYNTNGITAPGAFQGVEAVITPTASNDQFITAQWNLPAFPGVPSGSFSFASNGSTSLNQSVGSAQSWRVNCGQINVGAVCPPGTYSISCNVGTFPGNQTVNMYAQLVVNPPASGGWFFEF